AFAFTLAGRFSGLGLTVLTGFAASDPVVTPLAGFAGARRPHAPGGRTAIPAAFRYAPAVSRRTPVNFSMRRRGHPSIPSAITCCNSKGSLLAWHANHADCNPPSDAIGIF